MSLDAAELEKAIRDDDPARVRDLLAAATEGERAACAKALKPLLKGPGHPDFDDLMAGRLKLPETAPEQRERS